jgi:glycerate 2-kinase
MKENSRPFSALRTQALACFEAGIVAADPYMAVQRCIRVRDNHIELTLDLADNGKMRLGRWTKIHLIAFGKAACTMAKAVQTVIPAALFAEQSMVISNADNVTAVPPFTVLSAGHPLPDAAGFQAAQRVITQLKQAQSGELVLVLISGGGSALLPAPVEPITLAEKIATTQLLLTSGANINEINVIRKHLSHLKGGQLARLAAPADCHALILSDVIGDELSSIASGTTVADDSTYAQAIEILTRYRLWDKVSDSVQQVLIEGQAGQRKETPKPGDAVFKHTSQVLIGSNAISLAAAAQTAQQLGYRSQIYSHALTGIAREQAEQWVLQLKSLFNQGFSDKIAWLAGGETTVHVTGSGRGGRNQEFALAFAVAAKKHRLPACWVFLSGGTDGKDGLTDAAGGVVDPSSVEQMRNARVNATNRLNNNDAYTALRSADDLLITGATGTNVADLQVLLVNPAILKKS